MQKHKSHLITGSQGSCRRSSSYGGQAKPDESTTKLEAKSVGRRLMSGFTFMEIMIALMILSIFGSSLFMMQVTIFQKVEKPHVAVENLLEIDREMINLKVEIDQAHKEKKELRAIKIHRQKQNPDQTIDISIEAIKETSSLFKKFGKNVSFVQATTAQGKHSDQWITFLFTPPVTEEVEPKKSGTK
ncbi:MAG: prepilin-type N-terminal cleavage/methylation domain-containing protein [Candidatus Dependentiae bacterium]|nr:prepilin-type N-terminal cleavage/methylation domain-containing protein [Candidatus Dependentiae bacterium]